MRTLDNSGRSKFANIWTIVVLIGIVFILLGTLVAPFGYFKYKNVVNNSSMPIGSEFNFNRSEATVQLKNIYTDKNKDVLIAQLSQVESFGSSLPYRGTDYSVFLHSKSLKGYEEADILFGRFSTDGDLFLVIPKPAIDEVYTAYIMNNNYISTTQRQSSTSTESTQSVDEFVDEDGNFDRHAYANNLSKELSNYTYYGENDTKNTKQSIQTKDDTADMIGVRLTLSPAFDSREYQPTVINEELITKDNKFDFELFFDSVFRQTAITDLQKQYEALSSDIARFESTRGEYESRLIDNPSDKAAEQELAAIDENIESLESEQNTVLNKISEYEMYDYDETLFRYLNTKATVINK